MREIGLALAKFAAAILLFHAVAWVCGAMWGG